jgi:hypothetical protein
MLLGRNPRIVFDFDDAVHLGSKHDHVAWMCRHAAWVTAGSPTLLDFAARYSRRATLLPTVVDVASYRTAPGDARRERLRVGWLGSALSIEQTLFPHLAMLGRLQQAIDFELVIVSKPRPNHSARNTNARSVSLIWLRSSRMLHLFGAYRNNEWSSEIPSRRGSVSVN